MRHFTTLYSSKQQLVLKINPRAFEAVPICPHAGMPMGDISEAITFNTMYSHLTQPIGHWRYKDTDMEGIVHGKGQRPQLLLEGLEMEVGPRLLMAQKPYLEKGMQEGGFQADVIRKTQQVVVGWTSANKLIVAYYQNSTAAVILKDLVPRVRAANEDDPLVWLAKCDGGHAAHVSCFGTTYGRVAPIVGVMLRLK